MGKKGSKERAHSKIYSGDGSSNCYGPNSPEAHVMKFPRLHNGCISSMDAFRGDVCLSGGEDGNLTVFNAKNGQILYTWTAHSRGVTKVLCTERSGKQLMFSSSRDKTVKQWNMGSDVPVHTFSGHSLVVSAIACSSDGRRLMSGSRDNTVCLWDTETGVSIRTSNLARNIVADMKWLGDGDLCAQTGEDKILKLWDTRSLDVAKSFPIKQYFQVCLDCSDDGLYIATGSTGFNGSGCQVLLWDVRQGAVLQEHGGHFQKVTSCRFGRPYLSSQGYPWIVSVSNDCSVKVWKSDSSDAILTDAISATKELTCLTFVDFDSIAVGSLEFGAFCLKFQRDETMPSFRRTAHFW